MRTIDMRKISLLVLLIWSFYIFFMMYLDWGAVQPEYVIGWSTLASAILVHLFLVTIGYNIGKGGKAKKKKK